MLAGYIHSANCDQEEGNDDDAPPEMWPPRARGSWPLACPRPRRVRDPFGYALTWHQVVTCHEYLVAHAECAAHAAAYHAAVDAAAAAAAAAPDAYDSDHEPPQDLPPPPCPCQYHPVAIEERESCVDVCTAWPGPVCGDCWESQCAGCAYVFDSPLDAASARSADHDRLLCRGCAAEPEAGG